MVDGTPLPEEQVVVAPRVDTEVWSDCCDPSPDGTVTIAVGEWTHTAAAKDYDGQVIDIPQSACP